jgi:O-antigen/teichoic acid export membrane protein
MSLKKNVVANYLGQGWVALMGIAFIPLYVKYLGIEAYGLIGVFAILQAWLTLLDLGMTPTLNREMTRYTAGAHSIQYICDLLRSLEIICCTLAVAIALSIWISATWLSSNWLQAEKLPLEKVVYAICIMGVVVALRFVESLYRGAILGLQRQVLFNVVNACLATFRSFGVLGVLIWISPTIEAFFLWQGVVSIFSIIILAIVVYKIIPSPKITPKFSIEALKEVWGFARGMIFSTFLSLMLLQTDKMLLSKLLSLELFGYYTLAASISGVLYLLAAPISQSFYPRFTELVAKKEKDNLIIAYHQAAQLVAVVVIPAALMLLFFGKNVLLLWTGNPILVDKLYPIVQVLVIGAALNALMYVPYMLQLAYGWVNFSIIVNLIAVVITVPALVWITPRYGILGASSVWAILNICYVLIAIHFMHKRLLPKEKWSWYLYDVLVPFLAACMVVAIFSLVHPSNMTKAAEVIWLISVGITTLLVSIYTVFKLHKRIFSWKK